MSDDPQVLAALRRIEEAIEVLESHGWRARWWKSGLHGETRNIVLQKPIDVMK